MQGQQVQIPLKSPVDTSTFDIINGDTIFKDKNSIVYKGVLSNMTTNSGEGILSTTGKEITIDGDTVSIDDIELDYSDTTRITGESITTDYEVISADYNDTVDYVERLSDTKVKFHVTNSASIVEALYDDTYYVSGAVYKGDAFVVEYRYDDTEGYYVTVRFYNSEDILFTSDYSSTEYGNDTFTVWYNGSAYGFGFNSQDMRKRCTISYTPNETETTHYFRGIGLLDSEGVGWGEPVPYWTLTTADNFTTSYETSSTDTISCPETSIYDFTDKGFEELDNGSLKIDLIDKATVTVGDEGHCMYFSTAAGGFIRYTSPNFLANATDNSTKAAYQRNPFRDNHNGTNYWGFKGFFPNIDWDITEYSSDAWRSDITTEVDIHGYTYYQYSSTNSYSITGLSSSTDSAIYYVTTIEADWESGWAQNMFDALISHANRIRIVFGTTAYSNLYADTLSYSLDGTTFTFTALNTSNNIVTHSTDISSTTVGVGVLSFYDFPLQAVEGMYFWEPYVGDGNVFAYGNNLSVVQADGTTKAYVEAGNPHFVPGYASGTQYLMAAGSEFCHYYASNHLSYVDHIQCTSTGINLGCFHMHDYNAYGDERRMTPKYQLEYNEGLGLSDPEQYDQTIGHTCIFANRLYNKGLFWDYSKGWGKYNLIGYGIDKFYFWEPAIFTTPLKDNQGNLWDSTISGTMDYSSGWPLVVEDGTTTSTLVDETKLYNGVRYHKLTEDNMVKEVAINHSFSGTESSFMNITTKHILNDEIILQVYAGVPMSFVVDKSLIWAPQDLGSDFAFGDNYIVKWDKNEIEYGVFGTDIDLQIKKIADYMFGVNVLGKNNLIIETYNGAISVERYAIPYTMNVIVNTNNTLLLPVDGDDGASNDVYYYGSGYNIFQNDNRRSTSVLIPSYTIQMYVNSDDLDEYNTAINNREGLFSADIEWCMLPNEDIDEFYTHTLYTTDITYKNTRYLNYFSSVEDKYNDALNNTSWWFNEDVTLYPIGLLTTIYGENYISPTVDGGDGYVARLYTSDNKLFTSYNTANLVYQGSEIFTIMTSNYYFDGKSIYYLGTQSDYSQNVFTAYALGMRFLANSPSEAYFYSEWDKCIYLFTPSATLQKSTSLSGMGNILDAAYSSHEQTLYILFDDGKLWCKTQDDSMIIETGITDGTLETINEGCIIVTNEGYTIYSPYKYDTINPIAIETEWLGNGDAVQKYPYFDIVLFDNTMETEPTISITTSCMESGNIVEDTKKYNIKKSNWKNNFYRLRVTPKELVGQAFKIRIASDDMIKLFSVSVRVEQTSDVPSVQFEGRK